MDIPQIKQQFDRELASAASEAAVRALRDKYLARKGGVASNLLRDVASAPAGERPALGKLTNELKQYIDTQLTERLAAAAARRPAGETVDVTLPGRAPALGHRHPLTLLRERIEAIFLRFGFLIVEGPELEDEYHNFEALNMPADHPARVMPRRRLRDVQEHRMDRGPRERHGPPSRVRGGRLRLREVHRVCVRRRHRAARAAQVGHRGHPVVLRERSALPGAVPPVRLVYPWLCELVKVPGDPESVATTLALRGFEVASIEHGRQPVIDFEITANRPDCLSTIGLAREASAAYGVPLRMPDRAMPAPGNGPSVDVAIEDADLCPRYCAQVFEVRIGTSPAWLQERLEAAGV